MSTIQLEKYAYTLSTAHHFFCFLFANDNKNNHIPDVNMSPVEKPQQPRKNK